MSEKLNTLLPNISGILTCNLILKTSRTTRVCVCEREGEHGKCVSLWCMFRGSFSKQGPQMLVVIESGLQNRKLSVDKMSLDRSQKMDGMPEETVCLRVGVCREKLQIWKILGRK